MTQHEELKALAERWGESAQEAKRALKNYIGDHESRERLKTINSAVEACQRELSTIIDQHQPAEHAEELLAIIGQLEKTARNYDDQESAEADERMANWFSGVSDGLMKAIEMLTPEGQTEAAEQEPPRFTKTDVVERHEDMSPRGTLQIRRQEDGDMIICVIPDPGEPMHCAPSIEFCSVGSGGGQSTHTLNALRDLMLAIELDNTEAPQYREKPPKETNHDTD